MNTVTAALNSRRFMRTFSWIAALVLIAGVVAFLIAYFGNTSDLKTNVGNVNSANSSAVEQATPKTVPLDPEVKQVANMFMKTAVARKNPAVAYRVSGPDIRQGQTLAEWTRDFENPNTGIPVVPFPVDQVRASPFKVDYSYKNEALLEVALLAKPGAKIKSQIFYIGVHRYGKTWRVNYWAPHNIIPIPSVQ
jgi:hypothetical protein